MLTWECGDASNFAENDDPFCDALLTNLCDDLELPKPAGRAKLARRQLDLLPRPRRAEELHALNGRKSKATSPFACRNPSGLRERLREKDARHNRLARKMAAEERLFLEKKFQRPRRFAGHEFKDGIDENERLTMRQTEGNGVQRRHCGGAWPAMK